jgi:hypothetical protein
MSASRLPVVVELEDGYAVTFDDCVIACSCGHSFLPTVGHGRPRDGARPNAYEGPRGGRPRQTGQSVMG